VDQSTGSSGAKVLVYGAAGMGKTVLLSTMPAPVIISAESGLLSLRRANLERLHGVNNPTICYNAPVIVINTVQDLTDAYAWATQSAEARQFQSVGIDSISEIAEVVLTNAKKTVKDMRQAYGELIEQMERTIRMFRDLNGKNVCMLAKMEPMKDELTGVVKYVPSMPGAKLAVKLPYFFDEVFRLGVNKTQDGQSYRYLQTQPDMQYEAKDRSGALAAIEPPNLTQLFTKILGA
jgi:phage nucleotide-binding protein